MTKRSSKAQTPLKILYLTRDSFPTFRVDIAALFGRFLTREGIQTTIVAAMNDEAVEVPNVQVDTILHDVNNGSRYLRVIRVFFADVRAVIRYGGDFDLIQVRNKIIPSLFFIAIARWHGAKFCYWMSFPYPEDDLIRVREHGNTMGLFRALATYFRGLISKFVLYKLVLPRSDHVFLQSSQMAKDVLSQSSIKENKITIVPMAIDLEELAEWNFMSVDKPEGRCIAYLGAMDRARRVDFLFLALKEVLKTFHDAKLLLIGDCIEAADWEWLQSRAIELGVEQNIVKTGWVQRNEAWSFLKEADIGVCALPDKFIFNSMSPTKAVEMLSLGLPCVVTEHPDQGLLVRESGGGRVTRYDPVVFGQAICELLGDEPLRVHMGQIGQQYITSERSYQKIAVELSNEYAKLCGHTT